MTLCNPIDCSTPGSSFLHFLLEFAQNHVHWVSDTIYPSHPLLPLLLFPSLFPTIRVFFQCVNSSHQVIKYIVYFFDFFFFYLIGWLKAQHSENEDYGIGSHHFMANRWGNNGNSVRHFFGGGSNITANGDCSHEIKRHWLLGRKVMINLDSILKSRDITCQQRSI